MKGIFYEGFEILHDFPSGKMSFTGRKYIKLISRARKEILIITPYFLPSQRIRRALRRAAKRGVEIKILLPKTSDVKILDLFRNRYLRKLCQRGIEVYYYPKILHSKLLIIDDKFFIMGSSNLDYRSFLHQFELNLVGSEKKLVDGLKKHFYNNLKISELTNCKLHHKQNIFTRLFEKILEPIRELF